MKTVPAVLASLHLGVLALPAADLKPDATTEIPEGARRPVVVNLTPSKVHSPAPLPLKADLPEGFEIATVAGAPLVTHPIMGCLDDRGRLFVGDATGVNWNKKQLETNPPNRILMLEDTDGDGTYDKSTVFADKLTFPQGGCWLDGSLYVCSPPSLWKLTDTDDDGVADQREELVTGFEYTGNAADVHGPWLHPNGRLYWCHGRKGHKVTGKDGKVVHEGLASGIWSCKPDGSDVQWHSLGCGDNPVKLDFTPEGEIIGVQNLYYSNPRGDTLVHWLYGGVYERSDQMKAIEGLPRTLEHMPVMYNFGHVAVSGCCFWKNYPTKNQEPGTLNLLVTHFNTQRVVRMELTPDGATYKATENEFLRLHDPDIHLTDVLEDADGSLLVLDTGGWFRIGCPSSLMAKPDALGAVYRVKKKEQTGQKLARAHSDAWNVSRLHCDPKECKPWPADKIARFIKDDRPMVAEAAARALAKYHPGKAWLFQAELMRHRDPSVRSRAVWSAALTDDEKSALLLNRAVYSGDEPLVHTGLNAMPWSVFDSRIGRILEGITPDDWTERWTLMHDKSPLVQRLLCTEDLLSHSRGIIAADEAFKFMADAPPAQEHAAILWLGSIHSDKFLREELAKPANDKLRRILLAALRITGKETQADVFPHVAADDKRLADLSVGIVSSHADWSESLKQHFESWLKSGQPTPAQLSAMEQASQQLLAQPALQAIVSALLSHDLPQVRHAGLRVIASQSSNITSDGWLPPLEKALAEARAGDLPLVLDAIKKLKSARFDDKLQAIASDPKQPLTLRLRALGAVTGLRLTPDTFAMVRSVLASADSSAAARIQAASMLATAPLKSENVTALAPLFASVGPIELKELLAIIRRLKDADETRTISRELAKNPVIGSQQESIYRSAFADKPPDIFETIILPALKKATEAAEARKRQLGPLADKVGAQGDASAGRAIYESGKGTCIACHQIGDKGRSIGPNLSKIGAIRTERDLLESILFPSNTLARDYEAHIIETADGQSTMGVIKSHTAEGLLVVDVAGLEKNIPHGQIVSDTQLTTSLMPMGLDQTLPENELCDLVAYLRSLK
jgi:putative membrane-bound dehydrogenase-like protein